MAKLLDIVLGGIIGGAIILVGSYFMPQNSSIQLEQMHYIAAVVGGASGAIATWFINEYASFTTKLFFSVVGSIVFTGLAVGWTLYGRL